MFMEQHGVHFGYEADVTAHLLDNDGKEIGVTGLLDTREVVSFMPTTTWESGLHQGGPNTDEFKIGSELSDLRSWKKSKSSPPHERTEPLDEFPCSGEAGRF